MNNIEKGRLLVSLFPERLPEMLGAIENQFENLAQNEQTLRPIWERQHSFDFWYSLATTAAEEAIQYSGSPAQSTQLLTEKLFTGAGAHYSIDCITRQATALHDVPQNNA